MNIDLDLQIASKAKTIPSLSQFHKWVEIALKDHLKKNIELSIRIVDEDESAELNQKYRKKPGPTNVLSFPADIDPEFNLPLLGDIIICAPLVEQQAKAYGKDLFAHFAHMTIHGVLHLLGYEHATTEQAEKMETLEAELLIALGFGTS